MPPEPSHVKNYEPLYAAFDSPLMQQLRREAYGEDIGQHSWVTADELRADIARLAHRQAFEEAEGPEGFARQQHYLEALIELSERKALSRVMYSAEVAAV